MLSLMLTRRTFLQLMGASAGVAVTGSELLSQAAAGASAASPHGSNGVEHVVVLMMENRSFDHFLSWLPDADGRHDIASLSTDGNVYPNYPLAPVFQGCGYSDPSHCWEGWLVQPNFGKMDGFLQRPPAPENNRGVTLAAANTFPVGYYTNHHHDHTPKAVPDLPVIGALAENYTVLDRYFCSFAGETFPNRFYQHAARTDRDHNTGVISTLPSIWDQLSPIPNTQGVPTGGYFFPGLPFLGLWGLKDYPFWDPLAPGGGGGVGVPVVTPPVLGTRAAGDLPNVRVVEPAIVVSNLAPARVVHHRPFEHASTLKLIESTFGLHPMTARDAHAQDLGQFLDGRPRHGAPAGTIPTSAQVPGPADDAAAVCSASSVQAGSPPPQRRHGRPL